MREGERDRKKYGSHTCIYMIVYTLSKLHTHKNLLTKSCMVSTAELVAAS